MKKLFFIFSVLTIMALSTITAFAIEGDGTEETPFLITNQGELEIITDFPDCHFKLANDIELEGTWIPLCKQTSSGEFKGVFDGAGYTISNLVTDGSVGGLFKNNSGTIKNLNVIIADGGMTGSGTLCNTNNGTISNCVINGDISGAYENVGGICGNNNKSVFQCKFEGTVESTISSSRPYVGGICGYNETACKVSSCAVIGSVVGDYAGGIAGYNDARQESSGSIRDCYFIGDINGDYLYKGGIAGENYSNWYNTAYSTRYYSGSIINCYAVPTFSDSGYGIAYQTWNVNFSTSYYDKSVSGLTSSTYGTPKSTVAMQMKQTYSTNWDFENVWGIDKNINNGYPYLLWEYPNAEKESPYTVNSVKITDLSGNELEEISNESFYFEVNVTKNDNSKNADTLIIALYDETDALIDLKYMSGTYYQNQSITFGSMINKNDKQVVKVKAFVWDSISGMKPLSNEMEVAY